ncbi:MEKHLA domain-containing protein [Cyanobacteria bacterium FACHB-DQ100]|nr:MEKHLA domain-containing protein [Cyanobacteria bacterium FACHB-DQ100]
MNSPWQLQQAQRLIDSFHHWTGKTLIQTPEALFEAPFVVVSHGTEPDPIFNYGNRQALTLWEMDWETFTQLPSRKSAEPVSQEERSRLLAQAKAQGYISDYRGVRISSTGKRFWIEDVILWTVLDELNQPCGQAATFSTWKFIL